MSTHEELCTRLRSDRVNQIDARLVQAMRLLVTGCRDWLNAPLVREVLELEVPEDPLDALVLYVGDCKTGVDAYARDWARQRGHFFKVFRADWDLHGRGAGPKRNEAMVCDLVKGLVTAELVRAVAFWDGISKGTLDCPTRCVKAGVEVRIIPK